MNKGKLKKILEHLIFFFKRGGKLFQSMFFASQANTHLHHHFEELGKLVYDEIKAGRQSVVSEEMQQIITAINTAVEELEGREEELRSIKKESLS